MNAVLVDLSKLRRPGVFVLILFVALATGIGARQVGDRELRGQLGSAPRVPTSCSEIQRPEGEDCEQVLAQYRAAHDAFELQRSSRVAALTDEIARSYSPVGVGTIAAGHTASVVGALVIFLIAALHSASEFESGTAALVLVNDSRRSSFLVAKLLSTWLVGVALMFATWAVLAVLTRLPVPEVIGDYRATPELAAVLSDIAKASLVVALFATIGTSLAWVTKAPFGTLTGSIGVLVFGALVASIPPLSSLSFVEWIADWMEFRPGAGNMTAYAWRDVYPAGRLAAAPAGGLILSSVAVLLVSTVRFGRRMEVVG